MKTYSFLVLLLPLIYLGGCNPRSQDKAPLKSSPDLAAVSLQPFSIDLIVGEERSKLTIQHSEEAVLHSPLSSLTTTKFRVIAEKREHIIDFVGSPGLKVVHDSVSLPACFRVSLMHLLKQSAENYLFLVTKLNGGVSGITWASVIKEFEYCKQNDAISIKLDNQEDVPVLLAYLLQRGYENVAQMALTGGGLGGKVDVGTRVPEIHLPDRISLDIPSRINTDLPQLGTGAPRGVEVGGTSAIDGGATRGSAQVDSIRADVSVRAEDLAPPGPRALAPETFSFGRFEATRTGSFVEQLGRNADEVRAIDLAPIEHLDTLGRGAFAEVDLVRIDGMQYARRIEQPFGGGERYLAHKQRISFLAQNEFAIRNPDVGFVRTAHSSVKEGEFVTISELRQGGELFDAIASGKIDAVKDQLSRQLRNQLAIYRNGFDITFQGKPYKMEFIHGDIKPDNIILNADGTKAAFIDFGTSRTVLVEDLAGGKEYHELLPDADGNVSIQPLRLREAEGTPSYMSPELREIEESGRQLTGFEAYQTLRSADAHAFNTTLYVMHHKSPLPDSAEGTSSVRSDGSGRGDEDFDEMAPNSPSTSSIRFDRQREVLQRFPESPEDVLGS